MAFTFLSLPHFLSPQPPHFLSLKPQFTALRSLPPPPLRRTVRPLYTIGLDGKYYPDPSDDYPEDSGHGVSKFQQIQRQASRHQKLQEADCKKHQNTMLSAIADVEDPLENPSSPRSGDDLFGDIDQAIALKRQEFVKQGLLKPNPKKAEALEEEEVVDLAEIDELQGLKSSGIESEDSEEEEGEWSKFVSGLDEPAGFGFDFLVR